MKSSSMFAATLLSAVISSHAHSALYQFNCITHRVANCNTGELQFGMEVIDLGVEASTGDHQVEFRFDNAAGGANSSISRVYFYEGALLGAHSILDTPEYVDFGEGTSPKPRLPGIGLSDPVSSMYAIHEFLAVNQMPKHGVNPGESLGIVFNLLNGRDYDDVLNALALPMLPENGSLTVGVKAIAFDGSGSASFLHDITAVPVPAAAWLFLSGMGVLWRVARSK